MKARGSEVARWKAASIARHPLVMPSLRLNMALFEDEDPLASAPKGMNTLTAFFNDEDFAAVDAQGKRLRLTESEIFEWAFIESGREVAAMPSANG